MSVFSKISLSRKAAKAHKAKVAEKEEVPVKAPYKHVPTHAAVDALSGAPSSWKHEDRPKIQEHHKRRSQLAVSRTQSTLSTTSYLNSAAGPSSGAPPLPRNSSYSSYNPTWFDRGGDVYYSHEPAQKRKRQSRGHSYHDSGIGPSVGPSPLASNMHSQDVSPAVSSGNSTSSDSEDHLEISVAPNNNYHIPRRPASVRTNSHNSNRMSRPQPIVYAEKDIFTRLHTSTTRKLGEAPLYDSPPTLMKSPVATTRQEPKPKKQRWSLLGKRNNANIVV
ncbi:hypothetical protein LSUE1_G006559 [Lachnellula suecica]|uniref:Uncharacterized protein n=1 Tax=Lachnellula suecica TaxID=602035 RepID=A0A8T9C4T3_9HELO|nr:hypothetical protein LSUE1_G006559 [Lachnellula suecica]